MIGKRLSPTLHEIEEVLWEFEANTPDKPNYTDEGFRAGIKIFMSVMLDKMWELQEKENLDLVDRENMADKLGNDIRNIVKTYTDIDTHKLYNKTDD